ncbi:MAG: hypothetical protein KAT54_00090, partial [Candidatus Marinimicrobia bacterium]|nr:hypothetical protein [Candidatus Neomarinimicrobiota bacterium]
MKANKYLILLFVIGLISIGSGRMSDAILDIQTYLSTNGVYIDGSFQAAVVISLKDPWHVNSATPADEFSIATQLRFPESDQWEIKDIHYPPHTMKTFAFFDEALAVYEGEIVIVITGELSSDVSESVKISGALFYQGCNDQVCLPPQETAFSLEIPILSNTESVIFQNEDYFGGFVQTSEKSSDMFDVSESFVRKGIIITFLLIFLGGLGLNLTPCVYPLIPITMSYFGGQTVGKSGK